jgi:hypothetical protein
LTQIILFIQHAEFVKIKSLRKKKIVKENEESFDLFENILFVKISKLNNYLAKTLDKPAIQLTWYLTDSMSCGYLSIHKNQEQKWETKLITRQEKTQNYLMTTGFTHLEHRSQVHMR